VRIPPWSMVTLRRPATKPAKVTMPPAAARTGVPTGVAMSTPQCPPYEPTGAKGRTTSPATGAAAGHPVNTSSVASRIGMAHAAP